MNVFSSEKKRLTKSERTRRREKIVSFIVLLVVSLLFLFPFIYMLGTSFKSDLDLQIHPESLLPSSGSEWTLEHYEGFIIRDGQVDNMPFWLFNSLWSTAACVVLTILMDLVTAYAVVFFKFRGRNFLVRFLFLWMAVHGVIGTAPSFAVCATFKSVLGVTGGAAGYAYLYSWLVIPGVTGIFNVLLMKNMFDSIPQDIIDSAKSDGASNMRIFRRIVCPLARSTIMLIALFVFVGNWNNLIFPQLVLTGEDSRWYTLTVALTGYTGGSSWGQTGVSMATSVFAMIPIILVFCFTQNKMIDGLATTGVKR